MTSGHWRMGLALASVAALMWGVLPIALKPLLAALDAYTITCVRLSIAAIGLALWQSARGDLPALADFSRAGLGLLAVATLGLSANYYLYLAGLDFITPSAAQVTIQLAPMLLLLGGMVFFHERFDRWQWAGFGALAAGLLLFFNHRLGTMIAAPDRYVLGVGLVVAAAVTWAGYALAQKQLLTRLRSVDILLAIYVGAAALFVPLADFSSLLKLSGTQWALLLFASVNTLVAYGAFAEALNHWQASRVSAVLACTPLITLGAVAVIAPLTTGIEPEPINALSVGGAALVVGGSMLAALSGRRAPPTVRAQVG